jgi:hypothetical protein
LVGSTEELSVPAHTVRGVPESDTAAGRIAIVQRELEALERQREAARLTPRSKRRVTGASIVFSMRLDPAEVRALEVKAHMMGIRPTVLARNLVRIGLGADQDDALTSAVDRLEAAVYELRSILP